MARAQWIGRSSSAVLLLLLCALLCAVVLVVPLAPPGQGTVRLPGAAPSFSPAGGRRLLLPAGKSRRFRPRRWNSAGIDDSKHEVPSGPNPDSNR